MNDAKPLLWAIRTKGGIYLSGPRSKDVAETMIHLRGWTLLQRFASPAGNYLVVQ